MGMEGRFFGLLGTSGALMSLFGWRSTHAFRGGWPLLLSSPFTGASKV